MRVPILKDPHPMLRAVAMPFNRELCSAPILIENMFDTLKAEGGVGLAAPQIGVPFRAIVIDYNGEKLAMINPVIAQARGTFRSIEGCLSVDRSKWNKPVIRPNEIIGRYETVDGTLRNLKAKGQKAAIIAHEIDHLDGVLFLDRLHGQLREQIPRPV